MAKSNKLKKCLMFIGAAAVCFLFFAVFPVLYKYYKYDNSGVPDAVSSTFTH